LEALHPVHDIVRAAHDFPLAGLLLNVLRKGQLDAYAAFRRDLDAAIVRQGARTSSLAGLQGLAPWFEPTWVAARSVNIDGAQPPIGGLEEIEGALWTLDAFQQFRARASQLSAGDLRIFAALQTRRPMLEALAPRDVGPVVRRMLVREALLGWKERMEREHPMLSLEREEIDQKVRRLAEIEAALRVQNRAILAGDIETASLGTSGAWEDVTRLRGPRALRLREIIERGANLGLLRLRPVWLVNPDTASRLLPLCPAFFDLVIFDEASQMLIEHATPALFRAGRAVVSGDDKQMPPTSFFRGRADSDDEEEFDGSELEDDASEAEREIFAETWNRREIKDCPDLLALGSGCLPRTTLQIHYRSKYRELIDFSNAAFYQARLSVPARHPDAEIRRVKPVEVVRADGIYTAQTNPNEADRVVDVLAQLWAATPIACPSVGVVTFNRKQADLIEERVEARAASDSAFLAAFTRERDRIQDGEDMGFFVKNVENVQGDERDVIVFSTTFGRDRAGAFRRFFGVLGQTGGERRLNVAVTRAREKVILVTSMPISDISDMLAVNRRPDRPRDYLQAYLDYATKLSSGELDIARKATLRLIQQQAERPVTAASDAFVDAVAEFVSGLGYEPVRANDGDTFGVDLAVVDRRTGQFGLAIECDSPWDRQGHLQTARARELWRPSVIRRAIPATHRVWSQAWFRTTADEQRRLTEALEAALN
jgi:primosomal replication protein N''